MSQPVLYGIANCDTCRKARKWLTDIGVDFRFHDLRLDGPPQPHQLMSWCNQVGWEKVINRNSTTFRGLNEQERLVGGREDAIRLIATYPLLLKRPLLETDKGCHPGFNTQTYMELIHHG